MLNSRSQVAGQQTNPLLNHHALSGFLDPGRRGFQSCQGIGSFHLCRLGQKTKRDDWH